MNIYPNEKNKPLHKKNTSISKKQIAGYFLASSVLLGLGVELIQGLSVNNDCELQADTITEIKKCQKQVEDSIKNKDEKDDSWSNEIPGSMHGVPFSGAPY